MRRSGWHKAAFSLGISTAALIMVLATSAVDAKPAKTDEAAHVGDRERDLYSDIVTAAKRGEWSRANTLAHKSDDKLTPAFAEWLYLTDDGSTPTFTELSSFLELHPGWPGRSSMITKAEQSIPLDMGAQAVATWFGSREPKTGDGAVRLGEAKLALGDRDAGEALIRRAWSQMDFTLDAERRTVAEHGSLIRGKPTADRLSYLLWQRRTSDASRILDGVDSDTRTLAKARMTLITQPQRADSIVADLPSNLQNDSGVLFDQARATRRNGDIRAALPIALRADTSSAASKWWQERHALAREAIGLGLYQEAYRLSSEHNLSPGSDFADAEWLAGWIALRLLERPEQAAEHFKTLYRNVSYPVSKARGAYWAARAHEASGRLADAASLYQTAATFVTTYYGQLAQVRISESNPTIVLPGTSASGMKDPGFAASELAHATRIAGSSGNSAVARPFFIALGEAAETAEQYAYVSDLASALGFPGISVRIAKKAMQENLVLPESAYPIVSVPTLDSGPEPALVLGIARQESEFDSRAESPSGAQGLMQLMPATAKNIAKQEHIRYEPARLDEPGYNMRLGMVYLGGLINRFNGSYALAIASYNAGPTNVRNWLDANGDPREANVDPIDWIEKIPFAETRNYVQRVLENTQVYRSRLSSKGSAPLRIAEDLVRPNSPPAPSSQLLAFVERNKSRSVASSKEPKSKSKPVETARNEATKSEPVLPEAKATPSPVPPPAAATPAGAARVAPASEPIAAAPATVPPPAPAPVAALPQPKSEPSAKPVKSATAAPAKKTQKIAAKSKSKHRAKSSDDNEDESAAAEPPKATAPATPPVNPFGNGQPESKGVPQNCTRMILDLDGKPRCADHQALNDS